jgi:hypothetical protein
MKRLLFALALALPLTVAGSGVAVAHEGDMCALVPTGAAFGQHVAMHAQMGMFDGSMNPGMHQGYSPCVP